MPLRRLTDHHGTGLNDALIVEVVDGPGPGGACHVYRISSLESRLPESTVISFQKGPILEAGVNGISHEVLLAILIDRLAAFQAGPYPCHENESALECLRLALFYLLQRTRDRVARNVEGRSAL